MNLQVLKNELDTDPLGRGYSGMSDSEASEDLNTKYRSQNKERISGAEAYNLTDPTEYTALSDNAKSQWLTLCAIESVDPFGPAASAVSDLFPPGGDTITALQSFRVESISRATELGLGFVSQGSVEKARAL